jgi:Tfp pilus assembly protein FimT
MNKKRSQGITLIEILLVVGLLVVLLSFAVPSINGAAIKAEMTAAQEHVEYSLQTARRTARMSESPVEMNISPVESSGTPQLVTFSAPGKRGSGSVQQIQDYSMPPDIALVSSQESFLFDRRGLVSNPGQIQLVSKVDESITSIIDVE